MKTRENFTEIKQGGPTKIPVPNTTQSTKKTKNK